MNKKLQRSRTNKVIAGVCGGIAEYFAVDPIIIRIIFIVLGFIEGIGVLAYLVAIFIMPKDNCGVNSSSYNKSNFGSSSFNSDTEPFMHNAEEWKEPARYDSKKTGLVIGVVLIVLGAIFFLKQFFHGLDMRFIGPALLIVIGAAIVYKGRRGSF